MTEPRAPVRYRPKQQHLEVVGHGVLSSDGSTFTAPLSVLASASIASLRSALRRHDEDLGADAANVYVADVHEEDFDDDFTPLESWHLHWDGDQVLAGCWLVAPHSCSEDTAYAASVAAATQLGGSLSLFDLERYRQECHLELTLRISTRGRSAGELLDDARRLQAIVTAALHDETDASGLAGLVRNGAASVLIGRYETQDLEVKSSPYRLEDPKEAFELAKDVAAMSNASGGLILLGAKTKSRPAGDEIVAINGCLRGAVEPREYRQLLRRRLHPRVAVRVDVLEFGDRELCLLQIPPCPVEDRPVLVRGTADGRGMQGLGFTWASREDDGTSAPSIETVHALLQAGRTALIGRQPS